MNSTQQIAICRRIFLVPKGGKASDSKQGVDESRPLILIELGGGNRTEALWASNECPEVKAKTRQLRFQCQVSNVFNYRRGGVRPKATSEIKVDRPAASSPFLYHRSGEKGNTISRVWHLSALSLPDLLPVGISGSLVISSA